ncbi:ABC transporter ATP-binding protein [Agrobacterium salinitolerans]|uniref:ABC transporter ATP-binding protein n=1 Tax=Agrobacterium salinitolerans TaxID=1183413 RepID=UPI00157198B5|nr:ABC transporter ATP-binding protein [Agrobacterium salinitolerans]NTA40253.1 ABC transporter ATP-binding protein [Agrobacterium salinitolerans]
MAAILALRALTKSFGAITIARDLNLEIQEGEAVGILGPNGAGKTTILALMTGALRPDNGSIEYEGQDIRGMSVEERCRLGMARAFQIPQPFGGMTVFENVMVAARHGAGLNAKEAQAISLELLERSGLLPFANLAAGKLTLLNRKRLELTRALATKPKVLLLDEIAGGLSQLESEDLINLILQVKESGVTIVWIEHVLHALLSVVSRTLVLYQGNFIADGDPHKVLADPKVSEIYMGIEVDG